MSFWKKTGLLIGIAAAAAFDIAVYASYHYYYRAAGESVPGQKIALLRTSNGFYPYNDLANYELGKAHFDLGMQKLQDPAGGKADIEAAVQYIKRALAINPTSSFSHLFLGQALLHLGFFSPIQDAVFLAEFKKAAALAGEDSQVYYEVGKVYLTRWPQLLPEERDFTREVLRRILSRKDWEKTEALLNIWELNVKDYSLMDEVLPSDAQTYRQYAEFLGDRSHSLEERFRYLSRAEALDFSRAKTEYAAGAARLSRFSPQESLEHLGAALSLLRGNRFYQAFRGENLISPSEYAELLGSVLLGLAKARLEMGASWNEVEDHLREYLSLDSRSTDPEALETYLRRRGVLPAEFGQSEENLDRLAFETWLRFKQAKYREVIAFGRRFEDSVLIVPESKKDGYVRILQVLGDAFDKVDSLFEAGDVLGRALRVDPENLETLSRIRRNGQRLDQTRKVEETDKALAKILSPTQAEFTGLRLRKGGRWEHSLVLDGRPVSLSLSFVAVDEQVTPLLTILFNDRLAWEGYLTGGEVVLSLATRLGGNRLQVRPVNRDISLIRMSYRQNPEDDTIETSSRRPQ